MDAALTRAVAELAGDGLEVVSSRPVGGGCISEAAWVELSDGTSRFVKSSSLGVTDMYEREVEGLEALAAVGGVRVPRGARAGRAGGRRFLLMEAIATGSAGAGFFRSFGRRLADLHRRSAGIRFGFAHDNYIGATPQPNGWSHDWVDFFRRHRLGHQLDLARRNGLADSELSRLGDRLIERLGEWLDLADEPACLLHGDLWGGNFMVDCDGAPVLIDPACYYGQREAELAMTRLFGGFEEDFYAAYDEAWPLPPGAAERTGIYKLYHLLNHLNLFGGSYRGQCVGLLKRLV